MAGGPGGVSKEATEAPSEGDTAADGAGATTTADGETYRAKAGGVAPRDASERLVFAAWAGVNGQAAPGVTSELPTISEDKAEQLATRLSERSGGEITAKDVLAAETLEPLADLVRESMEAEVEGNIRVLRARPEGSEKPSVFLFHPAGGSSVVYQPLTRRLPADVPVYGVERLEGELSDRAANYLDEIIELSDGRPIVLGGWSFGGALAYEVAAQLTQKRDHGGHGKGDGNGEGGTEVPAIERIVLLDTVQPKHPAPDTNEEMHARWDRYANFANKTYGLEFEVPHELLDQQGEQVMMAMFQQMLTSPELAGLGLPAGVLEHQRASFVDNRILDTLDFSRWSEVEVPVTLFRAERMHDGALELEPAYHEVAPDGGWAGRVKDLEIVQLKGDHLSIVDEPEIGKVGTHIAQLIDQDGKRLG